MRGVSGFNRISISIGNKLLVGIFAVLILITVIAAVGVVSIGAIESRAIQMVDESKTLYQVGNLQAKCHELLMPPHDYLIDGNEEGIEKFELLMTAVKVQLDTAIASARNKRVRTSLIQFKDDLDKVDLMARSILSLENPIGKTEGDEMMRIIEASTHTALMKIEKEMVEEAKEMRSYIDQNELTGLWSRRFIKIVGLIVALFLLMGGFIYAKTITGPLKQLTAALEKVSSGELTIAKAMNSNDEIGVLTQSYNNMISVLERTTVSRDYFNGVLSKLEESLMIIDQMGRIKIVNQATLDLLGYTESELVGLSAETVLSENPNVEMPTQVDRLLDMDQQGHIKNVRNTYFSKDGNRIPVVFSSSLMHDKNDRVSGMICLAHPMSDNGKKDDDHELDADGDQKHFSSDVCEIPLTNREMEIIKLIAEEYTNREISDKLFISVRTVETHRRNIMSKLNTKSVIALVKYADQNGII